MLVLHRARARLLAKAIKEGSAVSGNHEIDVTESIVTFYFRGTPITYWDTITGEITQDSQGFDTISTQNNQFKNEGAIKEYTVAKKAEEGGLY